MKEGDRVKVLDEDGMFIVKKVEGQEITLLDNFGFERIYFSHQIIPDIPISVEDFSVKREERVVINKKNLKKEEEIRIIDLHIGHLIDSVKDIQPHKILEKQLVTAHNELMKAKEDKVKKLILIHGKGKGILKKEIYKLLSTMEGIEYWEADIVKYKFGAVEIRFK